MSGGDHPGADDLSLAFRALRAEYAAELPGLIQRLAALLAEAATHAEAVPRARQEAHRLRGTAGSYGFTSVSEAAGRIEDALEAGAAVTPELLRALAAPAPQVTALISGSSK